MRGNTIAVQPNKFSMYPVDAAAWEMQLQGPTSNTKEKCDEAGIRKSFYQLPPSSWSIVPENSDPIRLGRLARG